MDVLSNVVMVFLFGFSVGCLLVTVIAVILYSSKNKIDEQKARTRHEVINTIGKFCATVENAFSSFRLGKMDGHSLREILISKIEDINTTLSSNIDFLDSYYVKSIERFIEDQKIFLMHNKSDLQGVSKSEDLRTSSRGVYYYGEEQQVEEKPVPTEDKPEEQEIPDIAEKVEKSDLKDSVDSGVHEFKSDAKSDFEKGATSRIPVEEIKNYAESADSISIEDSSDAEDLFTNELTQEFDTAFDKVFEPTKVESFKEKDQEKEKDEDASSPEETMDIDTSKDDSAKIEKHESLKKEENVFDSTFDKAIETPQVEDFKEKDQEKEKDEDAFTLEETMDIDTSKVDPVKIENYENLKKEESLFDSTFDIEATQEFNINDLLIKAKSEEETGSFSIDPKTEPKEEISEGTVEIDIQELTGSKKSGKRKKGKTSDESLITGDEVMDQMDNLFGIDDK